MIPCPFQKVFPSELVRDDAYFMAHAFNEAVEAWKEDEVPVGAVIVSGGIIIASAHNRTVATTDPTAHAEMLAITQAAKALGDWRLNECTLYVTKEPCPMCSGRCSLHVWGVSFMLGETPKWAVWAVRRPFRICRVPITVRKWNSG